MNNTLTLNQPFALKKKLFFKGKFVLRKFCFGGAFLLIIILSIFYIFQANVEAREKYLFQRYENQLIQSLKENQNLIISSIQTNSLNNIVGLLEEQVQSGGRNFEKVDKIHYIQILDTQFVAK